MKRKLLKKYSVIVAVLVCLFFLAVIMMGQEEEGAYLVQEAEQKESIETIALEKEAGNGFEDTYRTLNTDLWTKSAGKKYNKVYILKPCRNSARRSAIRIWRR